MVEMAFSMAMAHGSPRTMPEVLVKMALADQGKSEHTISLETRLSERGRVAA